MAEEYQESEIIFQESVGFEEVEDEDEYRAPADRRESRNKQQRRPATAKRETMSLPVNIPNNFSKTTSWLLHRDKEWDLFDDGEMVPPHLITDRRIAGKTMAFSVCTGNGRTLKGRDLSEVRNSILRMTGFLET